MLMRGTWESLFRQPWSLGWTAFLAGTLAAGIQLVVLLTLNTAVLHGSLFDPDCYMHLERALRMMIEGSWHESLDPRINAPEGFSIHWTALFDILLVLGAWPLRLLGLDPRTALYVWGSAISPVLMIAALCALAWGVRNRVSGPSFLALTALVFTQPQLFGGFLSGRPDHHSLIYAVLLVQIAWLYAMFEGRAGWRWAVAAGAVAGIGISTSLEALLTVLLVLATLTGAWLFYGARTLKTGVLYLAGALAFMAAWLAWEGGRFLVEPAYARVSVVHLVALGSGCLCLAVLALTDARHRFTLAWRGAAGALATAVSAFATASVFPDFFLGPWPHLDPAVLAFHRSVAELTPILGTNLNHLEMFFAHFTAPLLSLPLIWRGVSRGRQEERPVMLLALIGFVLFGGLALVQARWAAELQAVTLVPWVLTINRIMRSGASLVLGEFRLPLRTQAISGAVLLQLLTAGMAYGAPIQISTNYQAGCVWSVAIDALRPVVPDGAIVMTQHWKGPEILWRTGLRVVGGPYEIPAAHADTEAFLDGDQASARAVALRRHIGYVLVCRNLRHDRFEAKLARGKAPSWLKPVRFEGGFGAFRLFRVALP